ncbi:hypothetical protein BB560_004090 [Smittium megazygosporum]|uniref:UBA domain-containing protein n=1 Tax=Smittium megazygosporum TaxID=133381 RepID=A0A2T9ZA71_9FUNG|nr:hypothetical protein BB560_004090 [Smittium megazygosporum]
MKVSKVRIFKVKNPQSSGNAFSQGPSAFSGANPVNTSQSPSKAQSSEALRQFLINDMDLLRRLEVSNPQLVKAARESPEKFAEMANDLEMRRYQEELQHMLKMKELEADPFNLESQKQIEEMIRMQNVIKNMEHAMEYNPESFGSVIMLYVNTKINGYDVEAFVDSGAQATIMNTTCAERCGLMRLLDTRFTGIAKGVGEAKILGKIHSAYMTIGHQVLSCSFIVMEGLGTEVLFGLDMLKKHQACIDLKRNSLVINDELIPFLHEHEIPKSFGSMDNTSGQPSNFLSSRSQPQASSSKAKESALPKTNPFSSMLSKVTSSSHSASSNAPNVLLNQSNPINSNSNATQLIPVPPRPAGSLTSRSISNATNIDHSACSGTSQNHGTPQLLPGAQTVQTSKYPESVIQSLMDLGFTRIQVTMALDAAQGNADMAAELLFG